MRNEVPSNGETKRDDVETPLDLDLDPDKFPVDRYTPLQEIGKGASGVVYLCTDRLLGKKVAIKCLRSVTVEQLVSFQKEAKASSRLTHPGSVAVLDFGSTSGGIPFMVMEYARGISLEQFLEENGAMPVEAAISVFVRIAEVLSYAHKQGVFHRDVKSSNILLVGDLEDPEVKIIDFGLASIKHAMMTPTIIQGITIVGTPGYMSPDQARGLPYDQRSEIYALGCVMFEDLTGRLPFVGTNTLEVIAMHAQEPAPRLSDVRPDLEFPEELENIVLQCLEKEPSDRFESMEELRDALIALDLNGEQSAKTFETDRRSGRVVRRSVLVTLVFLCLSAIVPLYFLYSIDSEPEIKKKTTIVDKATDKLNLNLPSVDSDQEFRRSYVRNQETVEIQFGNDSSLIRAKSETPYRLSLYGGEYTKEGLGLLNGQRIRTLRLRSLRFGDSAFERLTDLPLLDDVYVYNCSFSGDLLKYWASSPIINLCFSQTEVKDDAFVHLKHSKVLQSVKLDECPAFTGTGWKHLVACPVIEITWIIGQRASIETEPKPYPLPALRQLSKFPRLNSLVLSPDPLDDAALNELATFKHLKAIRLIGDSRISGSIKPLLRLTKLRMLTFDRDIFNQTELALLKRALPTCKLTSMTPEERVRL